MLVGGCVENSPCSPCVLNGFIMNSELVALLPCSGVCLHPLSSFSRADASAFASFVVLAPLSSARYSLERDIASCNIAAIIGVVIAIASVLKALIAPPSSRPPNIAANCAICAM